MIEKENISNIELDLPRDECGIVVVVSPEYDAGRLAAVGITELQNRGHEMTGIVADKEDTLSLYTGFGTGSDLFPDGGYDYNFSNPSRRALAHARYSTQGTQDLIGAQPHAVSRQINNEVYQIAHVENGNLTNTHDLARSQGLTERDYATDNDLMAHTFMNTLEGMLRANPGQHPDTKQLLRITLPKFEGAFTSAVMLRDEIVVYSDHHGLKPAVIGSLDNGGTIIASEITALEALGARIVREMNPGEMVIIQNDGSWEAEQWAAPEPKRCVLELLYVMKPETRQGIKSFFGGLAVKDARHNAGRALAEITPVRADNTEDPISADFGFGLPNSGIPVGEGYCEAKGLTYNDKAVKVNKDNNNKKIHTRSFIAPTQELREAIVKKKLLPDPIELDGKKVEGCDDTLIRGTVAKKNAAMLREAGVEEIHMRIGAPMLLYTCELGIDLGTRMELSAARAADKLEIDLSDGYESLTQDQIHALQREICNYIGVDSLAFLTPELLRKHVLGEKAGEFCMKCMTGEAPTSRATPVTITTKTVAELTPVV